MKVLIVVLMFVSCSHKPLAPSWVQALRSGETSLKVTNGSTLLFRRLAYGSSREEACDKATSYAKADIKAHWPQFEKIAHTTEVIYWDKLEQDCSVTLAVQTPVRPVPLTPAERALKYAVNGTKRAQFERLIGSPIYLHYSYKGACWKAFYEAGATHFEDVSVCWKFNEVVGYCTKWGCTSKYP